MEEYLQRREFLMRQMLPNSIAIIPSAPEYQRNWDNAFPYRQNNDFYYLSGFNEPESLMILCDNEFWLFCRERDPVMETWIGKRAGLAGAKKIYGANHAYDIQTFKDKLPDLLKNRAAIYFAFGRQMKWDRIVNQAVQTLREKARSGVDVPHTMINPEEIIHEMRLLKSLFEIALMKKAADISVNAHIKAMQVCKPGKFEYELQAALCEMFLKGGSLSPAYPPIVGSGENSCILHYQENNAQIKNGDMVLIDAGAEFQNYASDITRSFPANGKFSAEQKAVYDIVLKAQLAAIEIIKPGLSWPHLQGTIVKIITEGLHDLGLLKGELNELIETKAYQKFYMHGSGHFLGLDTHDVGHTKPKGQWRALSPRMTLTVEPGIYITPDPAIPENFWHIGIRIEDDVLVTDNGAEVLSQALPKKSEDIEKLMQE